MIKNPKLKKIAWFFILSIAINLFLGWLLFFQSAPTPSEDNPGFPYLSKRIFVENQNDLLINFVPLREKLREMVKTDTDDLGFYFEYLPTGTSIEVNGKVEHEFASLIKVPIVMAYYLQTREKGTQFNQTFTIREDELSPGFGELWKKGAGIQITAREAIELILTQSDNTATTVLANRVEPEYIKRVFDNLDITLGRDVSGYQSISPKSYSSIFRSLYLSSTLTKEESDEVLEILSRSIHTDIMKKNLPSEISVAHKFGEIENQLLWDCGVIYVPKRPYLFCAFSQNTEQKAKDQIAEISKVIYDFVAGVNP